MATPKKPLLSAARAAAVRTLAGGKLFNAPPPQRPGSKIGMDPGAINRNIAQAPEPQATTGAASARMSATTYFTQAPQPGQQPSQVLYEADRLWARVTVILETAGPVAIGFSSNLGPVQSGKGILLTTGETIVMDISKGNKLYIQATGTNRVKVIVQSVPWLEQITGLLSLLGKYVGVIQ